MKSATNSICAACYDTPDEQRRRHERKLRHWYGLTVAQYEAMMAAQNRCCAICGLPFGTGTKLSAAVDHNHETGVIRGLLHQECNRGIGHFGDNPITFQRAALYLLGARTPFNANAGKYVASLKKQRELRQRNKKR